MKTLEQFELVKEFLGGQGIQPTVAMVGIQGDAWGDLVGLAIEWRDRHEAEIAAQQAELEGLTEEELAMRERLAEEERLLDQEQVLFHSSGYKPER